MPEITFSQFDSDWQVRQHLHMQRWNERLANMKTEYDATAQWQDIFTNGGFDVEHQVHGRHYLGKPVIIDMLLFPKFKWADGSQNPIGFECKRVGANHAKAFGQAVDYANSLFYPVLHPQSVSRPFVAIYAEALEEGQALMMAQAGVLNLTFHKTYGVCLRYGTQRIWSEDDDRGSGPNTTNIHWPAANRRIGTR